MDMQDRVGIWVVCLLGVFGLATQASAFELYNENDVEASVNFFGQANGGAVLRSPGDASYGFTVPFARSKFSANWKDRADLNIQLDGAGGNVALLDMAVTLWPTDQIGVRMGRYKTSVSREYLIGGPNLPFVGRALLNSFVPRRRIGAETVGKFDLGGLKLDAQVGLFQPGNSRFGFDNPQGQLFNASVAARLPVGLEFHAGYAQHVFGDNAREINDKPVRAEVLNRPIDAAVRYNKDGLDLHVEGLAVLDPENTDAILGGYTHARYQFGSEEDIRVEPGVAYDIVSDQQMAHRGTAGVNIGWWETPLETMINYRYLTRDGADRHFIVAALRASTP
jgi:hypothetical protein